jgi:phosphoribosylformylglycinamidine synthase
MADACRAFGIPVVGGNVSLYNESRGKDIDPTPVVGLLGVVDRLDRRPPGVGLVDQGRLLLLGERSSHVGGARVWKDAPELPPFDPAAVTAVADVVRGLVADGLLAGAHDIADGGLAGSFGELVARSGLGLEVGLTDTGELFSEAAGRVVVCVAPEHVEEVVRRAGEVPIVDIGGVGGDRLVVAGMVDLSVPAVVSAFRDTLPAAMSAGATH